MPRLRVGDALVLDSHPNTPEPESFLDGADARESFGKGVGALGVDGGHPECYLLAVDGIVADAADGMRDVHPS